MEYFHLLQDASEEGVLERIRSEVRPKGPEESESDEESGLSEPESEERKKPKKPERQQSITLLELMRKHFPDLECSSDSACLLGLTINALKVWHDRYGKDLGAFEAKLQQLAKIIKAMNPSIGTQRGIFVKFTSAFKKLYVPLGEDLMGHDPKTSPHVALVRKVLRGDKSAVAAYISAKEDRLTMRLRDKFSENYNDLEEKCLRMRDSPAVTRAESAELILAAMLACGCRKGEILDPAIEFFTWQEYREAVPDDISKLRFGSVEDDEHSVAIESKSEFGKTVGFDFVLVQRGVLKDKKESVNKFLNDPSDLRFVESRVVIKPTIFMTARDVVKTITKFREVNGITKSTFRGRVVATNRWSTREIGPLMKSYFPRSYALAQARGWEFGSHFARKLYANASFEVYADRLRALTMKYLDRSIWIGYVLAHEGSIATSLSYSNVVIHFPPPADAFKSTPDISAVFAELESLRRRVAALEAQAVAVSDRKMESVRAVVDQVGFVARNGSVVSLPRHKKRKYTGPEDKETTMMAAVAALRDQGVTVSNDALLRLGFGKSNILHFKKRHRESFTFFEDDVAQMGEAANHAARDALEIGALANEAAEQAMVSERVKIY